MSYLDEKLADLILHKDSLQPVPIIQHSTMEPDDSKDWQQTWVKTSHQVSVSYEQTPQQSAQVWCLLAFSAARDIALWRT